MTLPAEQPTSQQPGQSISKRSGGGPAPTKQDDSQRHPWEVYAFLTGLAALLLWVIATNDPAEQPAHAEPLASPEESYARTEACRTWLVHQPAVADDFLTTLREDPSDEGPSLTGVERDVPASPRPSKQIVDALDQSADSLRDAALVRHLSPADFDAFLDVTQTTEALHQAVTDLRPGDSSKSRPGDAPSEASEEALDLAVALTADLDDSLELLTIVCEDA